MARAPKLAQQVAERIEREILDQRLPPGHRLGTEAELTQRHGVSRAVLREAIRLVERHQIAETRRGIGGGLFVAQPADDVVARVLCSYLESIGLELDELSEARRLIELPLLHHAVIRASQTGAQELEEMLLDHRQPLTAEEDALLYERFRVKLGELSRSPVLALYSRTINEAGVHFGLGLQFSKADVEKTFGVFWKRHHAIARAIAKHDVEDAERQLSGLLSFVHRDWRDRKHRTRRPIGDPKRGDALARKIAASIRRRSLAPGTHLGSEPELIARYGVSRAAFREAVRMLEQHGIAETRRGHGLVVTEADPGAATRSASVYLAHLGLSANSLAEARFALEPVSAALAAERASVEQLAELVGELGVTLTLSESETALAIRGLHERITGLTGNRALALFNRVSVATAWGETASTLDGLPDDALETLRGNYTRLVGAIHDRDAKRARRLMTHQLEVSLEWWRERN